MTEGNLGLSSPLLNDLLKVWTLVKIMAIQKKNKLTFFIDLCFVLEGKLLVLWLAPKHLSQVKKKIFFLTFLPLITLWIKSLSKIFKSHQIPKEKNYNSLTIKGLFLEIKVSSWEDLFKMPRGCPVGESSFLLTPISLPMLGFPAGPPPPVLYSP